MNHRLHIQGRHFHDSQGRVIQLRGVNLGGSSKVPVAPDGATWQRQGFYDSRNISFVGRPFPLVEADEHFKRLKAWGLTFLRLLVTWEAIEHAGPGLYDEAYLDYLYQIVKKAGEHGFCLFIDPHQDAWSRFSGGDGAPGWTFDLLGMDLTRFHATGAAFLHQEYGDPPPRMRWVSNYGKFACATLFTLFFGGHTFAPQTKIEGIPAEDYLQEHYIAAVQQVAIRLKEFPHVLGYDTFNEPSPGYIGYHDLNRIGLQAGSSGALPTLYQGMLLAAGFSQRVRYKSNPLFPSMKRVNLNPQGLSLWQPGVEPIWRRHGVWEIAPDGQPRLLKPDYFSAVDGKPANFEQDFFVPFVEKYARAIRQVDPQALVFITPPPAEIRTGPPGLALQDPQGFVFTPHWYDGITVFFQQYIPMLGADFNREHVRFVFGRDHRRQAFARRIGQFIDQANQQLGGIPTVIGETGIPFNLQNKQAYRTGDFQKQIQAMDDVLQALEENRVDFALWNYTADNTNTHGDQWCGEDLSIFSRDQMSGSGSPYDGGRALRAIVRPYPRRTTGEPISQSFDLGTRVFEFAFRHAPQIEAPTEIFVPVYQYPQGCRVQVSDGTFEFEPADQLLRYWHTPQRPTHTIRILPG
jgi:hypothetical protein